MGKTPLTTTQVLMHRELVLYKTPRSLVWQCRYKVDHNWLRSSNHVFNTLHENMGRLQTIRQKISAML